MVAYNYWVHKGCFDVIKVSVNRVSTIYSLTHLAFNWRHCHILPKWTYWSVWKHNGQMICSLPYPKNECRTNVNGVSTILGIASWKIQSAARWHWAIIALSAAFLGKTRGDKIASMAKNERQRSVNDFWPCIIEIARAVRQRESRIALSATFVGKTCCDNIASMS